MSIIINGAGYMALVYEGFDAALTMVRIAYSGSFIKNEMVDVMYLFGETFKVLCFGCLAVGIISRAQYLIKLWLITAYMQIKWDAVGRMFYTIYEYFSTDTYKSKEEFQKQLTDEYGSLIGQVLTRMGIVLIIYRFYLFIDATEKYKKEHLDQKDDKPKEN